MEEQRIMKLSSADKGSIKLDNLLNIFIIFLLSISYVITKFYFEMAYVPSAIIFWIGYYFGRVITLSRIYYGRV